MAKNLKGYLNEPDTGTGDAGHEVFEPEPPHMPDAAVLARRHEFGDIGLGALLTFAAGLVIVMALVFAGIWYFMVVMQGLEKKAINARHAPLTGLTVGGTKASDLPRDHFPEPRLQPSRYHPGTDEVDMRTLRASQEAGLIQNGWERDPQTGGLKLTGRAIESAGAFLGAPNAPATQPAPAAGAGETGGAP